MGAKVAAWMLQETKKSLKDPKKEDGGLLNRQNVPNLASPDKWSLIQDESSRKVNHVCPRKDADG